MSMANYQRLAYRKTQVETANPGRILVTLYDAAIRFIRLARNQIEAGNAGAKGVSLNRAYAIISEFVNALDHSKAPELCANLEGIYNFMLSEIARANLEMDAAPLEPILTFLIDLKDAWEQAIRQSAVQEAQVSSQTAAMASR